MWGSFYPYYEREHRAPTMSVSVAAASLAARRLTTAANVAAAMGTTFSGGQTAQVEAVIDGVSDDCAQYCGLASDSIGTPPTFGSETLVVTFLNTSKYRSERLILPWRFPITSVISIVESGNTLTSTDYQSIAFGMMERQSDDTPICWSSGKIVMTYVAGWSLPGGVPKALEMKVIEQVKMKYLQAGDDPSVRAETLFDVYQATYNIDGGDSIGETGLLRSLENQLSQYKNWGT